MTYKYVFSLLCLLLLSVGYLTSEQMRGRVHAQSVARRTPFTAKMRLVSNPGTAQERIAGERIVGIRFDGTEIFAESLKGRPLQDRVVRVTQPDGRVAVMVGSLHAKSSWFTDTRALQARADIRRKRRENSCLSSQGESIAGHDAFHGMPVFVIEMPPERRNNLTIHAKSWMVPALDCFSVKSLVDVRDSDGNRIGVSLRETVDFHLGEPSDSLLGGIASAPERKPSQLQRDYLDLLGGPKCADCDQRGEALDFHYEMHQAR